jgi:hypothetical protein
MAKKRSAISDIIKTDMSRRTINGENEETKETADKSGGQDLLWEKENAQVQQTPDEKPAKKRNPAQKALDEEPPAEPVKVPAVKQSAGPEGAAFMAFINAQAEALGVTGSVDRQKLYDFLRDEAMRYLRGYNAARRFYQD